MESDREHIIRATKEMVQCQQISATLSSPEGKRVFDALFNSASKVDHMAVVLGGGYHGATMQILEIALLQAKIRLVMSAVQKLFVEKPKGGETNDEAPQGQ
jgi:hypothetical protein